jgi:hypothetical protein
MKFTKPASNQLFTITSAPAWPTIVFETDANGAHTWQWSISWDMFTESGSVPTAANTWNAAPAIANRGGVLTVKATAGAASATIAVRINGTNPTAVDVTQYLATKPQSDGFGRIVQHETKCKHFNASNEPIKSFDKGYGMCQLTTPPPTFEQAWNWNRNVDGGLALFAQKRASALNYLGQNGRVFTEQQVTYETVCRWNGGAYHRWDAGANKWARTPTILCDSKTGNIGWDMTDAENAGKTEAVLHARDSASYSKPPGPGAHWKYFGVCYADRVLHEDRAPV